MIAPYFLDLETEYDQLILNALKASRAIDILLAETKPDFTLSQAKQRELRRLTQHLNTSVAELGLRSHRAMLPLWNYTIKSHILFHVADQGANLHPCLVWNYAQEGEG